MYSPREEYKKTRDSPWKYSFVFKFLMCNSPKVRDKV